MMMLLAMRDIKAMSGMLRNNLCEHPAYAAKVKNIDEIHTYFDVNYSQLKARGEKFDDLMLTFRQAHAQSGDLTLVKYADNLNVMYFDGEPPADIDYVDLRRRMKPKFEYTVSRGTYGALFPEQEQIIALTSQWEHMSGETLRLSKKMAEQAKAGKSSGNRQKGIKVKRENNADKGGRLKNKKNKTNKRAQKEDEKWKKVPPKPGQPE